MAFLDSLFDNIDDMLDDVVEAITSPEVKEAASRVSEFAVAPVIGIMDAFDKIETFSDPIEFLQHSYDATVQVAIKSIASDTFDVDDPQDSIDTPHDKNKRANRMIEASKYQYNKEIDYLNKEWTSIYLNAGKLAQDRNEMYVLLQRSVPSRITTQLPAIPPTNMGTIYAPTPQNSLFSMGFLLNPLSPINLISCISRHVDAQEYLEKAEEYQLCVRKQITEIEDTIFHIKRVASCQKEEEQLFEIIRGSMARQSKEKIMKSAERLRDIHVLFIEKVGLETDKRYKELLCELGKLWE